MSSSRLAVAALLVSLAAACGTTVPQSTLGAPAADGLGGLGLPTEAPQTATTGPTGGDLNGATSQGSAPAPGTQVSSAAVSDPTGGSSALPTARAGGPLGSAPGVTATTIKIGVYTAQGFSKFASSAGFNVATGDQAAQAKAIITYLNAHGGLAGRKILPVYHDFNVATDTNTEYQAACTSWTQDTRVYAVVSPIGTLNDTLYACLSKAGVPTVTAGEAKEAAFFSRYANWVYQPTDMNLDRILSNNVDALAAAGFFGAKPKIGVVRGDDPGELRAVEQSLKPALARHGLSLAESFAIPPSTDGSTAYSSAVLRFRSQGITHVLFTYLGNPLLFMINAENQKYYPRYGIHSRNSPAAVQQGNAPAAQQHGAMGIGWQPMNDVDSSHDPGVISARQALCLKLLREAGQDTSVRATALIGLWTCDNLFFLQDALRRAPNFSAAGLRAGAEALGGYSAASTFRSLLSPSRSHDGAGAYRLFAFKDECRCYQYVSALKTAS